MTIASSIHGGEMVAAIRLDDVRLVTHEVETDDLHGESVGHGFGEPGRARRGERGRDEERAWADTGRAHMSAVHRVVAAAAPLRRVLLATVSR